MSQTASNRVVVFGASGFIGREVVRRLARDGYRVVAVGRDADRLAALPAEPVVLDLYDRNLQDSPVQSDDIVVQIAYLNHTQRVVELCPPDIERLVIVGSTRHLSKTPDPVADDVRAAMDFMETVDLPWVAVHPSFIYGGEADDDSSATVRVNGMQRIKRLIARLPVIPLPKFGNALIQPIHIDDVYRAILQAMRDPAVQKHNIDIAGPRAIALKRFIKTIAKAMHRRRLIVPMPTALLLFLNAVARKVPTLPHLDELEIRNLAADRTVDISDMISLLKVVPQDFDLAPISRPPSKGQ